MAELKRTEAAALAYRRTEAVDAAPASAGATAAPGARSRPLRVLMMPDATAGNPYQRRLADALGPQEVETRLVQPRGWLPLLRAVREAGRVDVLHLHWTHRITLGRNKAVTLVKSLRFLAELALLRRRGTRIVWTAHNLLEHERRFPRMELWTCRAAARLYDRIIVHGPEARRVVAGGLALPARQLSRLECIPHGHFVGAYPDDVDRAAARQALGIAENAGPVFVHFGQIRPYKGVWELLDAFERLELPDAVLIIAGRPWDAATAAALGERAERDPRVRLFPGFVPDARIQYYMRAADAAVLPYRDILTSGTAMLAMSFGRTVIMPRHGCSRDMVGVDNALLFDGTHADGLLRAMRAAAAADLETLGTACRRVAARCDWPSIATRTAAIYRGEGVRR